MKRKRVTVDGWAAAAHSTAIQCRSTRRKRNVQSIIDQSEPAQLQPAPANGSTPPATNTVPESGGGCEALQSNPMGGGAQLQRQWAGRQQRRRGRGKEDGRRNSRGGDSARRNEPKSRGASKRVERISTECRVEGARRGAGRRSRD